MSDTTDFEQIRTLLEEIRNNQRTQLKHQAESLSIRKDQFRVFSEQQAKAQKIQDRAEAIQEKSAQILSFTRRFFPFVIAAIVVLLAYVTWLLWRLHA